MMINDTTPGRWFRRVVWLGIAANVGLALPALAAPVPIFALVGLPTATPDLWPRFAALLLILLSVFYVPAALDVDRYRPIAWFAVGSRLAGAVFFLLEPSPYRLFGYFDLVFFLALGTLLTMAARAARRRPAAPRVSAV